MALDAATAQELLQRLNSDREQYIQSVNKTHELLIQAIAAAGKTEPTEISDTSSLHLLHTRLQDPAVLRRTAASSEVESLKRDFKGSIITAGDDSDLDDSESLFVDRPLQEENYTEEGFKAHLQSTDWAHDSRQIVQDLAHPNRLKDYLSRKTIFPTDTGDQPDRSHLTHYSIFDVGADGAPLPILDASGGHLSRSQAIWNRIKSTNSDSSRHRKAVGRITIVREPSPLLFAALHYTHGKHFDVDELFSFLVDDDPGLSRPPDAFSTDTRVQRSFSFTMEYFTIIGEGCEPMPWQRADPTKGVARTHIPISRCSSVVALSLEGEPMGQVKNKRRRAKNRIGNVYDPFSPWRVLSITAFPDLRSSLDAHDTTKHYVNGPEAFLVTLCAEYKDAAKRLTAVYKAIADMVDPPSDFIFNLDTRDKLLFEDDHFTYSRRYFWAYQTLGIMNEDINDMVTAYRESFKDSVWDGTDKIIWPGEGMTSAKHSNWRKRMKQIRKEFEAEIARLKEIEKMNSERMRIIKNLHNNLFNGTSVLESRRSVENAMITVQQGRNIKLLTLVTIFFLPLTFVTSVFGMTNMPQHGSMDRFAWATIAICIPTYLLIGSLNTQSGMEWWTRALKRVFNALFRALAKFLDIFHYRPQWTHKYHYGLDESDISDLIEPKVSRPVARRQSAELVPRGTFNGMPILSPHDTGLPNGNGHGHGHEHGHGHGHGHQKSNSLSQITSAGEKEKDRSQRSLRTSNPPATGVIPPHRPSIGVVPLPGQALPSAVHSPIEEAKSDSDVDPMESPLRHQRTHESSSYFPPPPPQSKEDYGAKSARGNNEKDNMSQITQHSGRSSGSGDRNRRRTVFGRLFRPGSHNKSRGDEFP